MIGLRSCASTRAHQGTGVASGSRFGPYRASRSCASARVSPRSVVEAAVARTPPVDPLTSVVIAHRLWTVQNADRIIVMDHGRVLAEGTHESVYQTLGAHILESQGVAGVRFAVWAPNAERVSVVGDFNQWDGRRHPMRFHHGSGI